MTVNESQLTVALRYLLKNKSGTIFLSFINLRKETENVDLDQKPKITKDYIGNDFIYIHKHHSLYL